MLSFEMHRDLEMALADIHSRSPRMADLVEFAVETGLTLDEIGAIGTNQLIRLQTGRVCGMYTCGDLRTTRLVELNDEAWRLLLTLALPSSAQLSDVRCEWFIAISSYHIELTIDEAIEGLRTTRRVIDEALNDADAPIPDIPIDLDEDYPHDPIWLDGAWHPADECDYDPAERWPDDGSIPGEIQW